jgi:hypothetical protein
VYGLEVPDEKFIEGQLFPWAAVGSMMWWQAGNYYERPFANYIKAIMRGSFRLRADIGAAQTPRIKKPPIRRLKIAKSV